MGAERTRGARVAAQAEPASRRSARLEDPSDAFLRDPEFALSGLAAVLLLALPASADPILSVTPTSIALSPTQTVLSFSVDPNGTDIAGLQLNLSALASGLMITSIQSLDDEISASGPTLVGGDYLAGFIGGFLVNRNWVKAVSSGEERDIEQAMPTVIRDVYRTYRRMREGGELSRSGEIVADIDWGDPLDVMTHLAQAAGF